ncbi:MAG: sugar phosphate isomerase/epimerase [bacterium]
MKIGVSTGLFHNYDLVNLLPVFKRTGFDIIEVGTGTPEWNSHPPGHSHSQEGAQGLVERLQTFRLKIHSLHLRDKLKQEHIDVHSLHTSFGSGLDISSLDDKVRCTGVEEVKKNIDLLSFLDGNIAIVHPGGHLNDVNDQEERKGRIQKSIQSLSEIVVYAKDKGIKVAVENLLPHMVCGYAHEVLDLVKDFDPSVVGICFDSSHANLAENPQEVVRKFAGRLLTVHFSDNHGQYDDHLTPGEGKINWSDMINTLKDISYNGVFMMEVIKNIEGQDPYRILREMYTKALDICV